MKKILITGYLGFIGSNLTQFLIRKYPNYFFYLVDSHTYAANTNLFGTFESSNVKEYKLDIRELWDIDSLDFIINLAAESHVTNSIDDCSVFIDTNITGTKKILEVCRLLNCKLIHFSTDEVYGDKPPVEGHSETSLLDPSNPYSATKASADLLIKSYARTYGVDNVLFRVTNNYGDNQHEEKLIPSILKMLGENSIEGMNFPLHDKGKPKRNWLNVMDTCNALDHILQESIKTEKLNEIYNCNGNCELENQQVLSKILSCWDIGDVSKQDKYLSEIENYCDFSYNRPGQDVRYYLNDEKLRKLGWSTQTEFDKEIANIVAKYKRKL